MNGRLYDPTIGRMLSPDNYVQDATNTQAYNRYSYVLNNPLKYTDPSGWLPAAWQEGNGDESNNISSSRARSGGGGFVMGNMSGFATMGWSSTFMQISSQYGTLAAMNAYSSGAISAINMARMNSTTTYVSFGMSGGQHHIRSQNNVGGAGEVKGKGELQMYSNTLFNNVDISQYMNTAEANDGTHLNPNFKWPSVTKYLTKHSKTVDKVDEKNDIGGDFVLGFIALQFEKHINSVNKFYSYSKYGKPLDGTAAFGSRFLTGNSILTLNKSIGLLGKFSFGLGVLTSSSQAIIYVNTNGQYGQHPGYTVGDIGTAVGGLKLGGPWGFAVVAGWTFVVKPVIQSNFTIGIQPSNTSYGLWRTFP